MAESLEYLSGWRNKQDTQTFTEFARDRVEAALGCRVLQIREAANNQNKETLKEAAVELSRIQEQLQVFIKQSLIDMQMIESAEATPPSPLVQKLISQTN